VLAELNLMWLVILNWLVGVLIDLTAKSMSWSSNRYISGKAIAASKIVQYEFLVQH